MAKETKYLFFDTEMSGCDQVVSIGFIVTDDKGQILDQDYYVIKPHKKIRKSTIAIHGITTEQAKKEGIPLKKGLAKFLNAAKECSVHVGFAPQNDILALAIAWRHLQMEVPYARGEWTVVDVARLATPYMLAKEKIVPGQTPSLGSLYDEMFGGESFDEHNALGDAKATAKCFWELMNGGWFNFQAILPHSKINHLCNPKPQPAKEKKEEGAQGENTEEQVETTAQTKAEKPKPKKKRKKTSSKRKKRTTSTQRQPSQAEA